MSAIDKNDFPFSKLLPKDLEIELSKNGEWIAKRQGKYLHSKYNPSKEAEKFSKQFIESTTLVLFGLGLGYHLLELIKQNPKINILVIEPKIFFLTIFKELHPVQYKNENILFFNNPSPKDFFDFFNTLKLEQLKKIKTIQINSLIDSFPKEYATSKTNFSNSFRDYMTNMYTEMEFQKIWHKNRMLNITAVAKNQHFNLLENRFQDKAAILIGAGTTLSQSIAIIKEIQKKTIIFTVDTALKPLLEQGVTPDFIVSLDAQKANFNDFCGANISNTNLICDITVYPQICSLPFKNIYFFETANLQIIDNQTVLISDPLTLWIKQCMGELGPVRSGGNVTSSAMEIIRIMGFNQLFLAGCDWGFPELGYHCQGAPTHSLALQKSNRLNSIEKISRSFYQNRALKKAINQKQQLITTDIIMLKYAHWTQNFIAETESIKKTYSLNKESLKIEGIDFIARDLLSKITTKLENTIRPLDLPQLNEQITRVNKLHSRIKTLTKETEDLIARFAGKEPTEIIQTKALEYLDKHTYMKRLYSSQILHTANSPTSSKNSTEFLLSEIFIQLTKSIKHIKRTQKKLAQEIKSYSD